MKVRKRKKKKNKLHEYSVKTPLCVCVSLQSIMLLLHSQRRYVFEYDQTDRLVAVTMPSMVKHTLQSLLSIGYYRNIYTPPDSQSSFMQDFTLDGRLLRTQYLGTGRSVIYRFDTARRTIPPAVGFISLDRHCGVEGVWRGATGLIFMKHGSIIFLGTLVSHMKT